MVNLSVEDIWTFWRELLIGIIVAIVIVILTKFWNEIRAFERRIRFKLLNVPARVRAVWIADYLHEPSVWLSAGVFEYIQANLTTDKISKQGLHDRSILLKSQRLGIPLVVWLEEEFDTSTSGTDSPVIAGYRVAVDMEAEMRIGFRDVVDFQDFITLAKVIHDSVREKCFRSEKPHSSYVISELRRNANLIVREKGTITDDELKVTVRTEEDRVEIISTEPLYLTTALSKYFPI